MKTRIMYRDHLYTVCPTMERLAKVSCVCMCGCGCVHVWMCMCACVDVYVCVLLCVDPVG